MKGSALLRYPQLIPSLLQMGQAIHVQHHTLHLLAVYITEGTQDVLPGIDSGRAKVSCMAGLAVKLPCHQDD